MLISHLLWIRIFKAGKILGTWKFRATNFPLQLISIFICGLEIAFTKVSLVKYSVKSRGGELVGGRKTVLCHFFSECRERACLRAFKKNYLYSHVSNDYILRNSRYWLRASKREKKPQRNCFRKAHAQ